MDKQKFLDILKSRVLIMDGATGTELQRKNYLEGVSIPEEINIKFPERIADIYSSYINAGSDVVLANTFGANPIRLAKHNLLPQAEEIIKQGISLIRSSAGGKDIIAAGDISSLGEYMNPLGKYSFDEVYEAFAFQASLISKHGADIIVIETMTEIKEFKAAILASKENFSGPVVAQMTFSQDGTTVTGTDLLSFIAMAESLGVDALGLNCSIGSKDLAVLARFICKNTNLPVSFKPNAGVPVLINGETVFPETKEEFISSSLEAFSYGVNMLGGCCGTNSEFIKALCSQIKDAPPVKRSAGKKFFLSTRTKGIDVNELQKPVIIGERINPTGKKKFQEELSRGNLACVKDEARAQIENKAVILDVNMGVPQADEVFLLTSALNQIQEIVSAPLCIDSSNPAALAQAVKNCAGVPIINSVNAEQEKLASIMPIAKRYGAALIALTSDDAGIPKTARERLAIAEKILKAADDYGVKRENIIFDYLTLALSSSPEQTAETLTAIKKSKELWPQCKTVLGVSNISFGLPARQKINSTFLKMACRAGLDFAIVNPAEDWSVFDAFAENLLNNNDKGAIKYMQAYGSYKKPELKAETETLTKTQLLYNAVLYGNKEPVSDLVNKIISSDPDAFKTVGGAVLSALNLVGDKFEKKEYFLPQIIMSAEAAQAAFALIKKNISQKNGAAGGKPVKVIMATVKGDMHDIGKNIVCAVLESYGFEVIDMGVNASSEDILKKAKEENATAVGLSALMTTTMPEMEKCVKLRNTLNLAVKIMVGGAAVTKKYAQEIGADAYGKDAMETAKYLKRITTSS
ncbi:MAG: homocysteine S-methyltransferase family protein [Endomicrobium sp.]|jgi:5-methyltetrahydrofolate--homocysteine methyltransferase|nr:homocysteine S-methyltransferase family protein [Endomicrobium sp.]